MLILYLFLGIVYGIFKWKQIYAGFLSFVYICIAIQLSRGEGWDPINQFNPATLCCACPKPGQGFLTSHVVVPLHFYFVISELRRKAIHFLDIGGIVDHHC